MPQCSHSSGASALRGSADSQTTGSHQQCDGSYISCHQFHPQ
ncbi:MAG: hypothetical protein V7K47_11425 [Nostoc sp.]